MFRKWHAKKESGALQAYNERANEFARNSDSVTKKIFEDLVNDEEQHFDKYDTELDHIKKFGENYLALQSMVRSNSRGAALSK